MLPDATFDKGFTWNLVAYDELVKAARQALQVTLAAWAVTGLVSLAWWLIADEPYVRALAMSCIVVAVLFMFGGGTFAARMNMSLGAGKWGITPQRWSKEYEEVTPEPHLTWLGSALIVAPQLMAVALLLLE